MPFPKRKIALIGATGSIGQSTLAVLRANPEAFELVGIAAHQNETSLQAIGQEFSVKKQVLFSRDGMPALLDLVTDSSVDTVLMATTGTIGLEPTLAAIRTGKRIALASKEILVLAGRWIMQEARTYGAEIIPVDSEHSAIFQCLAGLQREDLHSVRLTASGGPFLDYNPGQLASVTPEEALKHPTWSMGPKISVDSATLANKALEMIEARWLFDLKASQIEVVIHPQSIIHSLVETIDGHLFLHAGPTSMAFPIQFALTYPNRLPPPENRFNWLERHQMEFRPAEVKNFPMIGLARQVMESEDSAAVYFNAINEIAVQAFLSGEIAFTQIIQLIEQGLNSLAHRPLSSISEVLEMELEAKAFAESKISD